jgi:hypothetical protein
LAKRGVTSQLQVTNPSHLLLFSTAINGRD